MLRYWFNFKETRQITALQKLLRLYWMQIGMCLPKFDIYQVTAAPNCFISHENSWLPDFFFLIFLMSGLTFTLSSVTLFLLDNLYIDWTIIDWTNIDLALNIDWITPVSIWNEDQGRENYPMTVLGLINT